MTSDGPELYVATMTTFLSDYYDDLEDTLNNLESININIYSEENVTDWRDAILVDSECLKITRDFKNEHPGYITCIFEDNYDSQLFLWDIQKYK